MDKWIDSGRMDDGWMEDKNVCGNESLAVTGKSLLYMFQPQKHLGLWLGSGLGLGLG